MADGPVPDMTRSARTEESLELLKNSIDLISDAAYWIDPDGRFVFVNEAACKSVGYTRDELLQMRISGVNPKATPERWAEVLTAVRASKTIRLESIHRRKDGSEFPVDIVSTYVTFEGREYVCGFARDMTEIKRAEETLRTSEAQLRALFAAIRDVILVVDREGRYVSIAPTNPALLYRPTEELIGKRLDEVFPPKQAEFFLAHVRRALESRETVSLEYSLLIGGREMFFSATVSPMLADQVVLVARDITIERRLRDLQAAIYEISEATHATGSLDELFHSIHAIIGRLMDAKNFYIALYDPTTNLISFPYFVDEVDTVPEPFPLGRGMTSYVVRSGQALLATPEVLGDLEARGEIEPIGAPSIDWLGVPLKVQDKIIGVIAVQSYAGTVRYREADKEVLSYVSAQVAQEIERKRAEEALRESEETARALINSPNYDAVLLDSQGRVLAANSRVYLSLGTTQEEILGQDLFSLFEAEVGATRRAYLEQVVRSGEPVRFADERKGRWFDSTFYPVLDASGAVARVAIVALDNTEAKRAEAALRESDKMRAIGQLAGGVAHDFNNLLQALLGSAEVLRAPAPDPQAFARALAEVEAGVRRGAALTRQLLLFARREVVRMDRIDVNEVVRGTSSLLKRLLRENIRLVLELADQALAVEADRSQFEQVLVNLVVNASDAMSSGGTITLRSGRDDASVWLEVEDTGHGIPAALLPRIFEPFFTTKAVGQGTGLGLSVVDGIVTAHHGRIDVRSAVGTGTTMRVLLPAATPGPPPLPLPVDTFADVPRGAGERVLLVEDEASTRQALCDMLTMVGYRVTAAASAEEATRLPVEPAFDLLLTDLILPGAHGGELAQGLLERCPNLAVIVMSGYTDDEAFRRGVSEGKVRFLQKPFDLAAVAREIRAALSRPA